VWIDDFVNKIPPPFVSNKLEIHDQFSERFARMAREIEMSEFGFVLDLSNNSSPSEDVIKFIMLKNLPTPANRF
jgi:hypothetical protein